MYNGGMPKLKYNKNSIGAIIKKAEQGIVLTKKEREAYQFIVITSKQLKAFTEGLAEMTRRYAEALQSVSGVVNQVMEAQLLITKNLEKLFDGLAAVQRITALVQIPRIIIPTSKLEYFGSYTEIEKPLRIFVQPDEPFKPPKSLSHPKRKYDLPLTAVQIKGEGFTLEGEYVKGMTRKSEVGQLFELMIRSDLKGKIPDELIDQIKSSDSDELAYRARSYVIRDLKEILAGNKLELDMARYRGIKQYHFKKLTKRIRKSQRTKKIVMKGKTN